MSERPIEIVLRALRAATGKEPVRSGAGWMAHCPAHDDRRPSLSISVGEDGRAVLFCHAGCATEDICRRLDLTWADLSVTTADRNGKAAKRIVDTYDYRDKDGELLYQVVRFHPKDFRQRWPDGHGGWVWNLRGVERVLYRLPELLAADPSEPVFLVEGEKDADALAALGLIATTNPGGAGKWKDSYNAALKGRRIVIPPDNDDTGREHVEKTAASVHGMAKSVRILTLPDLPNKGDVSNWIDAGGTAERLRELAAVATEWQPDPDAKKKQERGPSQATLLAELAKDAELFHAPGSDGEAYATIPVRRHGETHRIRSAALHRWLLAGFYRQHEKAPAAQAMQDALALLSAQAMFDAPEIEVHVRCAEHDGDYWLDLADDQWRAVRITPQGWEVVEHPPVKFTRRRGMQALSAPVRDGTIEELRPFVNVPDADDWALVLSWLAAALRPDGPYPVLGINGEAGSAKSTTSRVLRAVVDPNAAPLRSEPRDSRDLHIAASNAWLVAFDNLSGVRAALSDDLCRLATGGGFATRELYSDREECIFESMRPILLNGIEDVAVRGDLADRAIVLTLPPIPDTQRQTEAALFRSFEQARPRILGALLDAVSAAMRNLPTVSLPTLPRMADFAMWATAAEPALGLAPGAFMQAYIGNAATRVETVIEASPIGAPVLGLMRDRGVWEGTAAELLAELESDRHTDERTRKRRDWPGTAKRIGTAMRRLAPVLRSRGIEVRFEREAGGSRSRLIRIENVRARPSQPSQSSRTSSDGGENGDHAGRNRDGTSTSANLNRPAKSRDSGQMAVFRDGRDDRDGQEQAYSHSSTGEASREP